MRNEKIAGRQLWFILFLMRTTIILAYMPVLTSADALQDAWISAIITLIGSEVFVFLISYLCIKFPNKTIIEYSQILLGNWLGKLLSLVFLWVYLQASVLDIKIYSELITNGFLPNTPTIFIISMIVFLSAVCVRKGIEVIGRMADVLFFIFLGMVIVVILISLTEFDIKNIQPVLARGWMPVLRGTLTPIALINESWVLGMLAPRILKPRDTMKIALTSIGSSILILVIIAFITIGVLSPQEAARATFPFLSLIRSVTLTDFLERAEILVIFSWGLGLFITLTTFLYSGAKGVSQWLNLDDYDALVWPMAVIWVVLTVHGFDTIFELYEFQKPEIFSIYGLTILLGPLTLLWFAYIVRKYSSNIRRRKK